MVDAKIDRHRLTIEEVLTQVCKLQKSRVYRDEQNLFYLEGVRNFLQVAQNDFEIVTILYSEKLLIVPPARQVVRKLRRSGIDTVKLTPEQFRRISLKEKASGIAAIVKQKWTKLHHLAGNSGLCWVALEKVRNSGNLGTLIRTSEAIGGNGFILIGKTIDPYHYDVIRATMGALFHQQLIRTSYSSLAHWIRRRNMEVIAASPEAEVDFHHFKYPRSTILFLGEERKGLSDRQKALCNRLIRIPMVGNSDSLNLAVAGSLMLYEIYKYRDKRR